MQTPLCIVNLLLAVTGAWAGSLRAVQNRLGLTLKLEDNICKQCMGEDFDSDDCLCSAFMWNMTWHAMKGCKSDDTAYDPMSIKERESGCICTKLPGPVITCEDPKPEGDQYAVEPVPMTPGVPDDLPALLKARGEYEPSEWEPWPPRAVTGSL
eukprot:gnl/MRDRNA2_/MRDRNA2_106386_c0_seq1.p2 gnl/MRDRNA2_/MRDRNA2_106386_c0~~gnl/MRDRNA2_/MRDRNA2_106386_c0_seq1.p2  ORF type:complete len:171 (+),score=22.83 gnl/MRDRNA2_/MRDRNA2_106386_c0_seq1:54-515(+)